MARVGSDPAPTGAAAVFWASGAGDGEMGFSMVRFGGQDRRPGPVLGMRWGASVHPL